MAHKSSFNATCRCGNMLQVFESDSKTGNVVVADMDNEHCVKNRLVQHTVADRCIINNVAFRFALSDS